MMKIKTRFSYSFTKHIYSKIIVHGKNNRNIMQCHHKVVVQANVKEKGLI